MSEIDDEKPGLPPLVHHRRRTSLFGPIVLIGIGVFFLLHNLDLLPAIDWNWVLLLQLWPLWLILLGLNLIVRQLPGAAGSFMSALVGLAALAVFGYILFFGEDSALLNRFDLSTSTSITHEELSFAIDDAKSGEVEISFNAYGADLYALEDSPNLIGGQVSYTGELLFDTRVQGSRAVVKLDTRSLGDTNVFVFTQPLRFVESGPEDRWRLGLNPALPLRLKMDGGSGSLDLNLRQLQLEYLEYDGGSGRAELVLPDGDYDGIIDAGSGRVELIAGKSGRQSLDISGGSGSMQIEIPGAMEARITVDRGSGGFRMSNDRFELVRGDQDDGGTWQTSGYDDAPDRVDIMIDQGSGSITIQD